MDFKGQKLSELISVIVISLFAAAGFLLGYWRQDFALAMKVFAGGVLVAGALAVPDWPYFNRHPLQWLPAKQERGAKKPKRKPSANWSNLWGAI